MLRVEELSKRFGGVNALDSVDMTVDAGRVHALLGENGAGKSTLLKCLSGVYMPDGGRMSLDGQPFAPVDPRQAEQTGLRIVHQELNLVPAFTAYENAFVGRRYPRRFGMIDRAAMRARFNKVRDRHGLDLDVDTPVAKLSVARRQIVEILRALMEEAKVLVLDEPTASLSEKEAAVLHDVIRRLASKGCTVIFVSHRLDEVFAVADDYTVLRNGRLVATGHLADIDRKGIVSLMAGATLDEASFAFTSPKGGTVLKLSGFSPFPGRAPIDLMVRAGEIVGIYGVVGSGRSSLLEAIWGASPTAAGGVEICGAALSPAGVRGRIAAGAAYVPEDRRMRGLVMHHSILDNALMPRLPLVRVSPRLPVISWRVARDDVTKLLAARNVKFGRIDHRIATLSGGNQQKVMIGRWVTPSARLFLLDEPTRGVDVRSKAEIHDLCRRLADDGTAVVFVSSDLEEVTRLAGRVLVMAHGRITLDTPNRSLSRQAIVQAAFEKAGGMTVLGSKS
ncbi:sugar ABC transporter ATP-binding protein [Mesorhizobium sp.]|uniref:sugar ABC transporter ATP-binding protein n=1 Tax=Mesorhizobium sp. TaxID=1871066 RepID=UPI000FEA9311|nr:sugar ABC transporter ATP-binding protein [Mesorhizobium sp.]RWI72190.1 MAG: sugar ABC transporter ATP-binding protein [Mesorhizobium sp.]